MITVTMHSPATATTTTTVTTGDIRSKPGVYSEEQCNPLMGWKTFETVRLYGLKKSFKGLVCVPFRVYSKAYIGRFSYPGQKKVVMGLVCPRDVLNVEVPTT